VYDSFLDPACESCPHNRLAIGDHPRLAEFLLTTGAWMVAVALVLAALDRRRWLIAAMGMLAAIALWRTDAPVIAAALAIGAVLMDIVRSLETRRRLRHLERVVGAAGGFEESLRVLLNDARLSAAYWLEDEQRFAATDGGPPPKPSGDQVSTDLRVRGRVVARVYHDPSTVGLPALADAIDGPALIVLENERLKARLASRASELQRSRARIVERADTERSRLERDVHDSAQQHLLALGFDLRVALAALDCDEHRAALHACLEETTAALDELRELSHGLYPPSLEAAGLASALRSLGRRTTSAFLHVGQLPDHRLPAAVERAVYALVADATTLTSDEIDVDVDENDRSVRLSIRGVVTAPSGVVVDRIAAIGGTIDTVADTIVAVIPCE
jgi:signal transduction histidine kinase